MMLAALFGGRAIIAHWNVYTGAVAVLAPVHVFRSFVSTTLAQSSVTVTGDAVAPRLTVALVAVAGVAVLNESGWLQVELTVTVAEKTPLLPATSVTVACTVYPPVTSGVKAGAAAAGLLSTA